MRLYDIIIDKIFDVSLFEMVYDRKKSLDKVRSLAITIAQHLVKLYAFDDQSKEHWIKELSTFLGELDDIRLKPNNKKLSGDTYYSLLWNEPLNNGVPFITHMIERFVNDSYENCKRSPLTDAQIYEQCEKTLHKISYDMANNKYTGFKPYI